MPNIVVAVPSHRAVEVATLKALFAMTQPREYARIWAFNPGAVIWANRGEMVHQFLKEKENHYLLFCDDDMVPPPHALVSMLSRDADVVAGLCCRRDPPYRPVIMNGFDPKVGVIQRFGWMPMSGCHPIWGSGLAFSLIKRHVLERVVEKFGPHIFYNATIATGEVLGEDVTFYMKSNECGFKTMLDADVHVGHLSQHPIYPIDAYRLMPFDVSVVKAEQEKDREIAALKARLAEVESSIPVVVQG